MNADSQFQLRGTRRKRARLALLRLLQLAQVDHAVAFLAVSRGWSFLGGPVNVVLLSLFLTPEVQGYYYAFGSMLALQTFVELSFYIVITQFASHEWSHLALDGRRGITGDAVARARLVSLMRLVARWYSGVALLFGIVVWSVGHVFLSSQGTSVQHWAGPWAALVIVTSLQLWLLPFVSILEGCGFVRQVNEARLLQAITTSLVTWSVLVAGGALWALPATAAVVVAISATLVFGRFRVFFAPMWRGAIEASIHWRRELWPMQWRLAGSGVVNYLAFSTFVPVVFYFHGTAAAGRLGLTWQMAATVGAISEAWLAPRVPTFGVLIARRAFADLDRLFLRTTITSVTVAVLGGSALVLAVVGLNVTHIWLAERMLSPVVTAVFAGAFVLLQVSRCESAYLRAHRQEPLLSLSIVGSVSVALLTLVLGARFGSAGAAVAFLLVVAVILVPAETWIWLRLRRKWHAAPIEVDRGHA